MTSVNKKSQGSRSTDARGSSKGFTSEEMAALKERAEELKAARSRAKDQDAEKELLAKVAQMPAADKAIGKRLHDVIKKAAPELVPRLWYGMPAYAKDGKVLCFYQAASKFKTRYGTLGFSDQATLDDGELWPVAFALKKLTAKEEAKIAALVKKAMG